MGLLDSAIQMLGEVQQQAQDPKAKLLQAAVAMLSDNSQTGGLPGLMEKFQQAGLGNLIGSWVGGGQNLPISGEQVQQALGDEHLQQLSAASNLPAGEVAQHLSDLLPGLIDQLTPNGEVPQGGLGQVGALLGQLMGHR